MKPASRLARRLERDLLAADPPETTVGKEKRAEAVARRLMADIVACGVQVGEIYGSERDLQARLDVSRSAVREAIRLLEFHSVARMRRGPSRPSSSGPRTRCTRAPRRARSPRRPTTSTSGSPS